MIHLIGPAMLASVLAGAGLYGLLARRNAVLVLIGAELLLNAANVLLITASALPAGGLAALPPQGTLVQQSSDPLIPGQVMTLFVITISAAEIGLALAVVLLLFRARQTSDLTAVRELGEGSGTYTEIPSLPPPPAPDRPAAVPADAAAGAGATAGSSSQPEVP